MPRLSEVEGCLVADRSGIATRVDSLKGKKAQTRIDLYQALLKARRYIDENIQENIKVGTLASSTTIPRTIMIPARVILFTV
jgi:hypothetical protein